MPEGQVTVLMGANGAGKSTLVKILCGVHAADAGEISLFDAPFAPSSPADAFEKGVVTVHQSINDGVIPDLDVASNLMLEKLATRGAGFFVSEKALRVEAERISKLMGLNLNVRTPVADLGVADRQMIAIARAMASNPKVLILDEPTSVLTPDEADQVLGLVRQMAEAGEITVLMITHKFREVTQFADDVSVLRRGRLAGGGPAAILRLGH